jgi:hypothetical protein
VIVALPGICQGCGAAVELRRVESPVGVSVHIGPLAWCDAGTDDRHVCGNLRTVGQG